MLRRLGEWINTLTNTQAELLGYAFWLVVFIVVLTIKGIC